MKELSTGFTPPTMDYLIEILKIVAYIGGGFLIAFRVANYYITRDTTVKAENSQMKEKIGTLEEKIDQLLEQTSDFKVLIRRVEQLEKENVELKQDRIDIVRQLSQIFKVIGDIRLDLKDKANRT